MNPTNDIRDEDQHEPQDELHSEGDHHTGDSAEEQQPIFDGAPLDGNDEQEPIEQVNAAFDEVFPDERIVEVDAPGLTTPVLSRVPYRDVPRPVFPLDDGFDWRP